MIIHQRLAHKLWIQWRERAHLDAHHEAKAEDNHSRTTHPKISEVVSQRKSRSRRKLHTCYAYTGVSASIPVNTVKLQGKFWLTCYTLKVINGCSRGRHKSSEDRIDSRAIRSSGISICNPVHIIQTKMSTRGQYVKQHEFFCSNAYHGVVE